MAKPKDDADRRSPRERRRDAEAVHARMKRLGVKRIAPEDRLPEGLTQVIVGGHFIRGRPTKREPDDA
jgi:hypothetical protein